MKNVNIAVSGQVLTITVDLAAVRTTSKSGQSLVIASTEGNISLPGQPEMKLGLNLYTSRK